MFFKEIWIWNKYNNNSLEFVFFNEDFTNFIARYLNCKPNILR